MPKNVASNSSIASMNPPRRRARSSFGKASQRSGGTSVTALEPVRNRSQKSAVLATFGSRQEIPTTAISSTRLSLATESRSPAITIDCPFVSDPNGPELFARPILCVRYLRPCGVAAMLFRFRTSSSMAGNGPATIGRGCTTTSSLPAGSRPVPPLRITCSAVAAAQGEWRFAPLAGRTAGLAQDSPRHDVESRPAGGCAAQGWATKSSGPSSWRFSPWQTP